MHQEESIAAVTNELKNILLKTQKEMKARDERFKKYKNVHEVTKKEYQNLYRENLELKKKLEKYENYCRNQQKEKTKKDHDLLEKQQRKLETYRQSEGKKKKKTNILEEISKLKELDLLKILSQQRKNKESSGENEEEEDEKEEKPKKRKKKKVSIMDLINN